MGTSNDLHRPRESRAPAIIEVRQRSRYYLCLVGAVTPPWAFCGLRWGPPRTTSSQVLRGLRSLRSHLVYGTYWLPESTPVICGSGTVTRSYDVKPDSRRMPSSNALRICAAGLQ